MKLIYFIFGIIIFLLPISCVNSFEEMDGIPVPIDSNSSLSNLIEKVDYLQLETNDQCIISNIDKLCMDTTFYYVVDKSQNNVYLFDKNGSFYSKVTRFGNGPEEYLELTDVDVNNNLIYILSNPNKSIYVFKIDGEFVKKISLNDWFHHIDVHDECIYLHSSKSNNIGYDVVVIDYKGKIKNNFLPFQTDNSYRFSFSPFQQTKNSSLLTFPYDSRIALLEKDSCEYKYKLEFDTSYKLTVEKLETLSYEEIKEEVSGKNYLYYIDGVTLNSGNQLCGVATINYTNQGLRQLLFKVNTYTGESSVYKLGEEISTEYPYLNNIIAVDDEHYYSIVEPMYVSIINENFDVENGLECDEDDNPIICIYKLKKQ